MRHRWRSAFACVALIACAPSETAPAPQTSGGEASPATEQAPAPEPPPPSAASTATDSAAPPEAAPVASVAAEPAPAAANAGDAVSAQPPAAVAVAAAAGPAPQPSAAAQKPANAPHPPAAAPKPASAPAASPSASPPSAAAPAPAAASAPAAAAAPAANARGRVVVELKGLKSDAGQVLAALFRTSAGFPEEPQRAQQSKAAKIRGRRVELAFDDVPPGQFAVSLFHDEDSNGKLKKGMFGIPSEGYGFTRDARGSFGPPSFEDARLQLSAGETKQVTIHMEY